LAHAIRASGSVLLHDEPPAMVAKRKTAMRRVPRQERAVSSVDAILTAAKCVIEKQGLEKLTTVRVAEVAGVSVGTLYQYFPSKEAILGALLERRFDDLLVQFAAVIEATRTVPIELAIRSAIAGLVQYNQTVGSRLHAPYIESMSSTGRFRQYRTYMEKFIEILAAYFESRSAELRIDRYATAAFLLASCADGIAQGLAFRSMDGAESDYVIDEASALVTRYLLERSE
jgi:AcrR family transcriptional regulator